MKNLKRHTIESQLGEPPQISSGRAWEDHYDMEDHQPVPLVRRSHWIALALGLTVGLLIGFSAHAQDACQVNLPKCAKPLVHVTQCVKWFGTFNVSQKYEDYCIAKLPRLVETLATIGARNYLRCRCEYQGSIWDRRDP